MRLVEAVELATWVLWKLWWPLLELAIVVWLWRCSLDVAASAATETTIVALMTALPERGPERDIPHDVLQTAAVEASWWTPRAQLTEEAKANVAAITDAIGEIGAQRLQGRQARLLWDRFTTLAMTSLVDVAWSRVRC